MSSRRKLTAGFAVMAGVLALSSVAYACTVWVGQFTVSADTPGHHGDGDKLDPYESVTTYGTGLGMAHCWMTGAVRLNVDSGTTQQVTLDYRAITPNSAPACPSVGPTTAAPTDGTYTVSYLNTGFGDFVGGNTGGGTWSAGHGTTPDVVSLSPFLPFTDHYDNDAWDVDRRLQRVYVRDCMAIGGAAATWTDPVDFIVAGGVGITTRTVKAKPSGNGEPDLPGTESAICIQQKGGTYTGAPDGGQAPIIVV